MNMIGSKLQVMWVGGWMDQFRIQSTQPKLLIWLKPEISVTLGLGLDLDIHGPVLSGLDLENCSNRSLSLDHQEFPNLGLETETDF